MAMAQYVKAAVALAVGDTEAARAAASNQEDGTKSLETERGGGAGTRRGRRAVGRWADSARKVPALDPAQKRLTEIAMMIRERAQRTRQLADNKNTLTVPLQNLLAAYEARQTALENEQTALAVEAARWSEYYSARLAGADGVFDHQSTRGGANEAGESDDPRRGALPVRTNQPRRVSQRI